MARVLRYRNVILGLVALAAVLAAGYFLFTATSRAQAKDVQPISFSHRVMVQKGIPCLYCHADARRSPAAGMPSVQKCMGCHLVIARSNPEVKKLTEYWQKGEPVPWVRINQLPRFVYFSHQAHLSAGLNCERCHGDVAHMEVLQPVVKMDMGWCINCHKQQPQAKRLTDCITCHQ
jgi:hypothetical protein